MQHFVQALKARFGDSNVSTIHHDFGTFLLITSSDFSGFYNMRLTSAAPFITKIGKGGSKRKTYRRTYKKNKRSKTKRRKLRSFK